MRNKIKDVNFAFRIAKEDLNTIRKKANKSEMSVTDFFTKSALGKNIIIIDDLSPMITKLKAIGNNINQLTMLANIGNIKTINLSETRDSLTAIHERLSKISEVL